MGHLRGKIEVLNFVGPPGFEPRMTEPKSGVLPLHHGPFFLSGTKLLQVLLFAKFLGSFFI